MLKSKGGVRRKKYVPYLAYAVGFIRNINTDLM